MAGILGRSSSSKERFLATYPTPEARGVKPARAGTVEAGGVDIVDVDVVEVLVLVLVAVA